MFLPDSTRSIETRISRAGGDSQGLVQQRHSLGTVHFFVPFYRAYVHKSISYITFSGGIGAGPVQLEPVARPLAEGQASLEVGHDLAQVSHGLRQKDERAVAQ